MCSELVGAMPKGCEIRRGGWCQLPVVPSTVTGYSVKLAKLWNAFIALVFIPGVLRLVPNSL